MKISKKLALGLFCFSAMSFSHAVSVLMFSDSDPQYCQAPSAMKPMYYILNTSYDKTFKVTVRYQWRQALAGSGSFTKTHILSPRQRFNVGCYGQDQGYGGKYYYSYSIVNQVEI